jgi:hypothetical protein
MAAGLDSLVCSQFSIKTTLIHALPSVDNYGLAMNNLCLLYITTMSWSFAHPRLSDNMAGTCQLVMPMCPHYNGERIPRCPVSFT